MRIVSLLPSATEILYGVGAGDDLVGVTFECDYPPRARENRVVSTTALPEGLTPAEIDSFVSQRVAAGEDLYHLDGDALRGLRADLVVTQDLCAVCAVDVSTVSDALDYLGCDAEVLTVDPHTLPEVLQSIRTIAAATDNEANAAHLVEDLEARLAAVRERVAGQPAVPAFILEWTNPPFAPGHWIPDMVATAGGQCVLGSSGQRSFRTDWDTVAASGAEVVVSAPCGYELPQAIELTEAVADWVPSVPLWAVNANAAFARPGPRLVDGVETLAGIFHPDTAGPPVEAQRVR